MMFATQKPQTRGMRRPDRPGDGVVHIAGLGGLVAVGKATRQVPHPNELVERGGRPVLGLGVIGRTAQMPDFGTGADQFGQQRTRNDPAPEDD